MNDKSADTDKILEILDHLEYEGLAIRIIEDGVEKIKLTEKGQKRVEELRKLSIN